MSIKDSLPGWDYPNPKRENRIRKYSTTGDILSYKRCRKQYGFFKVRGFVSATVTQMYFGTLVHDVMDRINRNYQQSKTLPSYNEIETLVSEAHDLLYRSGVKAYNPKAQRELAAKQIDRFVQMLGPAFFPYITKTEYRLERALQTPNQVDYILSGVVDVLAGSVSHVLKLPVKTSKDDMEIWDYKSGKQPTDHRELEAYKFQLHVYAELYNQQNGHYPSQCALVFLGELGDDKLWNKKNRSLTDYPKLIFQVSPSKPEIVSAMDDFHVTVETIDHELALPYDQQWQEPTHPVDPDTCDACSLRYGCRKYPYSKKLRTEPL